MFTENSGVKCYVQFTCPNCASAGEVVHAGLQDFVFGAMGTWGLRRCSDSHCNLLWLDPMPAPAETYKFYQTYYTHSAPSVDPVGPQAGAQASVARVTVATRSIRLVKRVLAQILFWRRSAFLSRLCHLEDLPPGRLLEVGCGSGQFLREAADAGWQAQGIDFDDQAIAAARATYGVDASAGDLLGMNYRDSEFDAIVMNNVIEHLPDPIKIFHECARILKPGGRLVMITPNSSSLGYKTFTGDWRGLEIPRHLHIFSPANLRDMAKKANFGRVSSFTSPGAKTGLATILASAKIREMRLRRPAEFSEAAARRMIQREAVLALFGKDVGEFAVLVAHK